MKKIWTTTLFFALCFWAGAQAPGVQVLAFKQFVASGVKPKTAMMEGGAAPASPVSGGGGSNLWLYLLHPKGSAVTVTGIYINGKPYHAKCTPVSKTPVLHTNEQIPGNPKYTTLVPKTTKNVLFIEPAGELQNPTPLFKKAGAVNEVVVRYVYKGKTYLSSVKRPKQLDSGVML